MNSGRYLVNGWNISFTQKRQHRSVAIESRRKRRKIPLPYSNRVSICLINSQNLSFSFCRTIKSPQWIPMGKYWKLRNSMVVFQVISCGRQMNHRKGRIVTEKPANLCRWKASTPERVGSGLDGSKLTPNSLRYNKIGLRLHLKPSVIPLLTGSTLAFILLPSQTEKASVNC